MWTIDTTGMSRCEWLDLRRMGLGGSDAAAVCGVSPWTTPRGLYEDKLGNLPQRDDEPEHLEWGRRLEPVIREAVEEKSGYNTAPYGSMVWSDDYPIMFVDLDGIVLPHEGTDVGVLEIKTTFRLDGDWGPAGSDQVPIYYRLQCEHAMLVTGMKWCVLAVLVSGQRFLWYEFEQSQRIADALIEKELRFWERVEHETPPGFDTDHASTGKLLVELWPETSGTVYLPQEAQSWHETFQALGEQEKAAKAGREGVKNLIVSHMGAARVGLLPDGTAYVRDKTKAGAVTFRHTTKV